MKPEHYEAGLIAIYILGALALLALIGAALAYLFYAGWRAFNRILDHMTFGRWLE